MLIIMMVRLLRQRQIIMVVSLVALQMVCQFSLHLALSQRHPLP